MPTDCSGLIPAGIWKLDVASSQLLSPKTMTLWIIKNTIAELQWVAVETNAERRTSVHSWHGRYGGEPAVVTGAGIQARLTSAATEGIRTEGEFPGLGHFVEFCRLSADGRRMICDGEVSTDHGRQTYREEFDWFSGSPHELSVPAQ
jgi:hypothetical protein